MPNKKNNISAFLILTSIVGILSVIFFYTNHYLSDKEDVISVFALNATSSSEFANATSSSEFANATSSSEFANATSSSEFADTTSSSEFANATSLDSPWA